MLNIHIEIHANEKIVFTEWSQPTKRQSSNANQEVTKEQFHSSLSTLMHLRQFDVQIREMHRNLCLDLKVHSIFLSIQMSL
jgi:hypothetical protein